MQILFRLHQKDAILVMLEPSPFANATFRKAISMLWPSQHYITYGCGCDALTQNKCKGVSNLMHIFVAKSLLSFLYVGKKTFTVS